MTPTLRSINSEEAIAWFEKGQELRSQGSFHKEAAIDCFDRAIELNPGFALTWSSKAGCLYYLHYYEAAQVCIDRALQIDPADPDSWCIKGDTEGVLGRREQAIEAYKRFLCLDLSDYEEFEIDEIRNRISALKEGQPTEAESGWRSQEMADRKPLKLRRPLEEIIAEADENLA